MKRIFLSLGIGLILFCSSYAITSKSLNVDDCPSCDASTVVDGQRCILHACSPITNGSIICMYVCGGLQVPIAD